MQDIKISSWKFVLVEALVIVIIIGATYYLTSMQYLHLPQASVSTSTIYTSTTIATTTINQTNAQPYLTSADMSVIFGPNAIGGTYSLSNCNPENSTNSNFCKNIAFFSTTGNFTGYMAQFRASGLNLNEILLVKNKNSQYVYSSLTKSLYPNSTTGYYPSNVVINDTENGALYSIQFGGSSYTNIYIFKDNDSAFIYLSGDGYNQNYTKSILDTAIEKMG